MFVSPTLKNKTPITIVGGGLAGSILAWSFMQKGFEIHLFSDGKPSASSVAAGLINPVTGQRFVLAEHTPSMLKFAQDFYRDIEKKLHISCFYPTPMQRIFHSEKEQENCEKRLENGKYAPFFTKTSILSDIHAEHSGVVQTQTAWLDTNTLLDALHDYFKQHHSLSLKPYSKPPVGEQSTIYCEGYRMLNNPLFSWLPLQAAHGEIITCRSDKALPKDIIHKSKWLLPTSAHQCRIGATYEVGLHSPTINEQSKQQLLDFAHHLFKAPQHFEVVEHQAGIRPTTLDKQPFIGFHPKHPRIAIFNGFGSRGCLMMPWCAEQFIQQTIPESADIQRYKHLCD
jgi:glycine/D-amino acid oxidase-like deaminating enzyme